MKKRSRLSMPVTAHEGLEEENAETANLDNCFQVCIDNLDAADQEQEMEIRVFDDAKRTSSVEKDDEVHSLSSSARHSEAEVGGRPRAISSVDDRNNSKSVLADSRSGSILCS